MQIVTYRGPSQPGGVASLIQRADCSQSTWWHIRDGYLQAASFVGTSLIAEIPSAIIEGHYKYSNEFLWPLMHGRFDLAYYNEHDRNCYRSMNLALAANLNWYQHGHAPFVHDYQLALVPHYLSDDKLSRSVHFWHIPWPQTVPEEVREQLLELARSLICCKTVGFHTSEYVQNFLRFVDEHVEDVQVDFATKTVTHESGRVTRFVVSPGGIDYSFWETAASSAMGGRPTELPYVLSVDRADYTKGIAERIDAVRLFFERRPELKGKMQFVFGCQRTREGLLAFDEYWQMCRNKYEHLRADLSVDGWSPILWLPDSVPPEVLAGWYAQADAMLVNPSRDGLNLTAKEFVASAGKQDSSLILSRGAGVWHELKDHVSSIESCNPAQIADAIFDALNMPAPERRLKLQYLKRTVRANSWHRWWNDLTGNMQPEQSLSLRRASASGAA